MVYQHVSLPTIDKAVSMFSNEDEEETFSWRGDEETNFSDWTIEINETDTYHVHRLIFSVGDRKCDYFSAVFRGNHAESASRRSRICLKDRTVAATFPLFLDYVYNLSTFQLERESVAGLMDLADYFVCPSLTELCINFVVHELLEMRDSKTIDATKALDYLIQFFKVGHGNVVEIILPVFFGNLAAMTEQLCGKVDEQQRQTRSSDGDAPRFQVTTELFDFIMASPYLYHAGLLHGHYLETSNFVSRYLTEHNPDALCLNRLLQSTQLVIMPIITTQAANRFLDMIQRVQTEDKDTDWDCLAKLAVRCYDALQDELNDPGSTASLVDDFVQTKSTRVSHMLAVARLTAQNRCQALERENNFTLLPDQDDDSEETYEIQEGVDEEDIYMEDYEQDGYEQDVGAPAH